MSATYFAAQMNRHQGIFLLYLCVPVIDAGLGRTFENRGQGFDFTPVERSLRESLRNRVEQIRDVHWFDQDLVSLQQDRVGCSGHFRERTQEEGHSFGIRVAHGTHYGKTVSGTRHM